MSLHSHFLTLSIKEQLFITILVLTSFSIIVILVLPGSFSYEILREDYKKKKTFFYNEYSEYMQASFYLQSYTILQYEEILKRMTKQIYKYYTKQSIFEMDSDFKEENKVQDLFNNNNIENEDNDILYQYCYNNDNEICDEYKIFLKNKYESLNGLIFSHDIYNRFKIPGVEMPIINSFVAINANDFIMYSFNKTALYKAIINYDYNNSSKINKDYLKYYYSQIISKEMGLAAINFGNYLNLKLFLFKELFRKVVDEMGEMEQVSIFTEINNMTLAAILYSRAASGYYSTIDLPNDKFYLVSYEQETDNIFGPGKYYYFELSAIKDFLDIVNGVLSKELNMDFIAIYPLNHTIIYPGLCINFMMKQSNDLFNEQKLNEEYNKIIRGSSGIDACFYDKKIIENQKIKEMFAANISHFLNSSSFIHQGLINLNEPYFFMKYSIPHLNTLMEFQTEYLLLDWVNFYLFASFRDPLEYSEYIWKLHRDLFYLIVILILYIWGICFFVNMIIYCKVSKQLTEPIYKLQEAIETSNLKDENIFKYEYDDMINELFITCKELLTCQIDTSNNNKYSGQFSVLSISKDKDKNIDKSKYEKNLIINNDIMNQLINEQQNMMDFNDEIDINEDPESINNNINDINSKEESYKEDEFDEINNIKEDEDINENVKKSKVQDEYNRDKESYKNLFRLAEYLYYYSCKVEGNIISLNLNSKNDDKKSVKSKINNNNNNNSLKNSPKLKRGVSKGGSNNDKNDENININILKDKDITYLWYMEMKKKNNKSFNYQISDDYEELFIDYNSRKN